MTGLRSPAAELGIPLLCIPSPGRHRPKAQRATRPTAVLSSFLRPHAELCCHRNSNRRCSASRKTEDSTSFNSRIPPMAASTPPAERAPFVRASVPLPFSSRMNLPRLPRWRASYRQTLQERTQRRDLYSPLAAKGDTGSTSPALLASTRSIRLISGDRRLGTLAARRSNIALGCVGLRSSRTARCAQD